MEYQVAFQNPTWTGADAELVLHQGDIPPVPSLNIMCPKFCASIFLAGIRYDFKPFLVVSLYPDLDEVKVAVKWLWYDHSSIATPLFEQWDPQWVQLPIGKTLTLMNVELHLLYQLEWKGNIAIPLITKIPAALPLKPKKKRTPTKLADVTPPPPTPTTAPPTTFLIFALSVTLPAPAPFVIGPPALPPPHLVAED